MEDLKDLGKIICILAFVLGGTAKCGESFYLLGKRAEIEQLREDVERVDVNSNEDVLGQVVEINRLIRSKQRYNTVWAFRFFIPDGWDNIRIIDTTIKKDKTK